MREVLRSDGRSGVLEGDVAAVLPAFMLAVDALGVEPRLEVVLFVVGSWKRALCSAFSRLMEDAGSSGSLGDSDCCCPAKGHDILA